jgi:hypothetical protein
LLDLFEADLVAERFELALESAGAMFGRVTLALPVGSELSDGRLDHRLEMAEVGTVDADLRSDDDLALVGRGLGVVSLEVGIARPLIRRESGSVVLIFPVGVSATSYRTSPSSGGSPRRSSTPGRFRR